ncbi:valine--tRNA ligase [Candidatus Saccharibacteria bacterium]|nr:valine--tRNA ligase [Candidatus Saccharibacteria bacterium]
MDKTFKPQTVEKEIYKKWERSGAFSPAVKPSSRPFTIIMPPPNANAPLHVGHALFVTLQDIMIRYRRMRGDESLWLPGADHAGILTQVVYERELGKRGKTRRDLGRERFYKEVYNFTQKNKKAMYDQLRALGASCGWSKEKFTLDPKISDTVLETFVRLHKRELVYRGERLVNWCPRCETTLSNLEVIHEEKKTKLWYIRYPLKGGGSHVVVATTRPETMLGDTAVAVNPKDRRYKKLVGKTAVLPLLNREIPVIKDNAVDPKFGTGAVKVTPAHDPADYEMSARHNLSQVTVIGFDDRITAEGGAYEGFSKKEARKKVVEDLKTKGLIENIKDYTHSVGICERCKTTVEPLLSLQWFVKTKPLAEDAMKAVRSGKIKILPKRFNKVFFHWMENIEDWNVSRQLWWGHRMPVWYCGTKGLSELQKSMNPEIARGDEGCGQVFVQTRKPPKCPKCKGTNIIQDPDTFDTWFSSGQWPYTTLGFSWNGKHSQDFKYFYPTSVMETGYEILFFWVARMIMLGLFATGKIPFETVYLHGLVRDAFGKKMSKSAGNVVDPMDIVETYGADALRFALIWGVAAGNDSKIGEKKIEGMRNFANKIWNIGRFTKMSLEGVKVSVDEPKELEKTDVEFLRELDGVVGKVGRGLDNFRFSHAAEVLYEFVWHRVADVYIEKAKGRLKTGDLGAIYTLSTLVTTSLKLLHPFMPFVTEEVWKELDMKGLLLQSSWPAALKR